MSNHLEKLKPVAVERTHRGDEKHPAPEPVKHTRELENEIEHLRTRLDVSLSELDRRRHEYTDVKLQLRKHPEVLWGAVAVGALIVGGIGFAIWRASRRDRPVQKAKRFSLAMDRATEHPERVAKGNPSVGEKILAAVGTTVAVSLTKKALEAAWAGTRRAPA